MIFYNINPNSGPQKLPNLPQEHASKFSSKLFIKKPRRNIFFKLVFQDTCNYDLHTSIL